MLHYSSKGVVVSFREVLTDIILLHSCAIVSVRLKWKVGANCGHVVVCYLVFVQLARKGKY